MLFRSAFAALSLAAALGGIGPARAEDGPPAYVIVQSISITDRVAFSHYQVMAREAIARYGGRFLARGTTAQLLEGTGDPPRLGLIAFPSVDLARQWFTSKEFQEAMKLRATAGEQRILLVEGKLGD